MKKNVANALLIIALAYPLGIGAEPKKENKPMSESNIITLSSGLRYQILKNTSENSESPKRGQQVIVHYTGWLNDGKDGLGLKFDSSIDRGQPFNFNIGIGQVIRGWDEGVAHMKKGQKIRLYIPSILGYGSRGAGNSIPGNSDLIFDVELIDFK